MRKTITIEELPDEIKQEIKARDREAKIKAEMRKMAEERLIERGEID